jgi:hypothetical protein
MNRISESKRLILETKYKKELNFLLEKAVKQKIYTGRVDEGVWDSIKHGLAKLTSLRKMLPSSKRDAAEKQIQAIIDRADAASNKAFSELSKTLKASGYPNQKSADEFLAQTMEIGKIYDSIVASAEAGETDPAVANEMIKDLRRMMQYYMDYELESVYKRLSEAEGDAPAEDAGPLSGDKKTMSMEELRSTLAPKLLGLSGLAGIIAGVLMHTDWFFNLVMKTDIIDMRQSVLENFKQSVNRVLQVEPGEGPTEAIGRWFYGDPQHYSPYAPFSDILNDMKKFGLSDEDLASLGRGDAAHQAAWLEQWKNFQEDPSQSLAKIFGAKRRKEIPWDVDPAKMVNISETITTTVIKTIGGRVKRTALTGIGAMIGAKALGTASVLLPAVGVALVTSGAAVYFLRKHGQKYSRLATLDGLLQRMEDVDPSKIKAKVDDEGGAEDDSAEGGAGEEEKKSGGNGEVVHIFRKGPHKFIGRGKKDMNLVDKLMGGDVGLPNWAVKDVTNRIKQELENKGFVVKEGLNLENLLEKKKKKKKKEKPRKTPDAVPAKKSDTTRAGGATRSAKAAQDAREKVGPAMDRDVAGPGDNRGKIARMVIEFGSDTTVVKAGKTLRFSRKQLFDNPDEFIAALSPEEKALLMRLPEDPQKERSKFDFFKMTTDQRKELYLKMKQGKVDFEKEFRNQPKAQELATDKFFISDLRDILETGHTAHGEQPIDPEIIRDAMETISDYLGDYLDDAGVVMRETVELNRWSVLAGIKTVLRG